jgi:serine/threonine protein kinase
MTTDIPNKIGKYEILGIAGKGGMGLVYSAYDPVIDRKVAIKIRNRNTTKSLSQKVIYYMHENHSKTKSPQGLSHTRRSLGRDPTAAAEACHASPAGMPQKTR